MKKIFIAVGGIVTGIACGFILLFYFSQSRNTAFFEYFFPKTRVIGFLPYWLITRAKNTYSPHITDIAYFALTINSDGTIRQMENVAEAEPGWHALSSGKLNRTDVTSLVLFSLSPDDIELLVSKPEINAQTLIREITPIMDQYTLTDLNLDLESFREASDASRTNFTAFVRHIRENSPWTLTIEIAPDALLHKRIIDLAAVAPYVDRVVLMAYDFHYAGSFVTGAVSPLSGFGKDAEFDTESAIRLALSSIEPEKLYLGAPLYGYQWETISESSRSAVLPDSGVTKSSASIEDFLRQCASCSPVFDRQTQESSIVYKDQDTGTFYQAFYPTFDSLKAKKALVKQYNLGGLALWALGYEDSTILTALDP